MSIMEDMNKRTTIADVAREAGVSVSTVNRILSGGGGVRHATIQSVQDAAERVGYYGVGAIAARKHDSLPRYRLGFLLQQSTRAVYRLIADKIREAVTQRKTERIDAVIEFVDQLVPDHIAERLHKLGDSCDAVAVIAADHPVIGQTIQQLHALGKPVVAYITDQSARERAAYVGTDNWRLGRTAAWLISQTTQGPGRVAVFIGHHRYQCQDVSDASFRSYIREHAPRLTVDDSRPTHEDPAEAYHMVKELLQTTDDLVGILIVGGGISGVLQALREAPEDKRQSIKLVCRDLGPETRKGLSEGLITAALCHPLEETSAVLLQTMIDAIRHDDAGTTIQRTIGFEIMTPENV